MNSIDARIARLQNKLIKDTKNKSKRQLWIEQKYIEYLKNQGGACICGYKWEGHDFPIMDYADKKFQQPRGLLCYSCDQVIKGANESIERLEKCIAYIKAGGSNNQMQSQFELPREDVKLGWKDLK